MKLLLIALAVLVLGYVLYSGVKFYLTAQSSKKLIDAAVPYQNLTTDTSNAMLILGDSTGVGVGADTSAHTLGGLISSLIGATYTENHAVSGAVTRDLPSQIAQAKLTHYRLIFIQIGGNDIIRFHSAASAQQELETAIKMLPSADKVVIISAGNVGGATLFPIFIRPFHTWENLAYNKAFAEAASTTGVTFVNLTVSPTTKLIEDNPGTYLAADGLHPSSAGYALWLDTLKPYLPAHS